MCVCIRMVAGSSWDFYLIIIFIIYGRAMQNTNITMRIHRDSDQAYGTMPFRRHKLRNARFYSLYSRSLTGESIKWMNGAIHMCTRLPHHKLVRFVALIRYIESINIQRPWMSIMAVKCVYLILRFGSNVYFVHTKWIPFELCQWPPWLPRAEKKIVKYKWVMIIIC